MATQLLNTTWNVGASYNGGSSNYTFRLEVILETQDIANNKSRITVNKYVKGNSGNSWYGTACTDTFTGDITDSFSYNPAQSGGVGPMRNTEVMYHTYTTTSTTDIEHEPDGTKAITITTKFTNGGNSYAPNTNEKTFNVTLPTIARASTLTASSSYTISNTTGNFSYTVTSAAAFYHRLIWNLNGNTTLNLGLINATSASFTIANSALLAKIPSATSGTLTLTLRTYSDSGYSTQIGSDVVKTISLSVGADIKPSVTIGSIVLNSGGFNGNVLAGKSTVKVASWSVSLVGSATLPANGVTISGLRVTPTATSSSSTSGSITSNTLTASASDYTITFTVTATDSRGRSGSATTAAFTVKGYSAPTATVTAYRVASSSSSTRDDTGAYLYAGYTSAVGSSFSGANTISTTVWRYTVGSTNTNLSANPSRVALSQENSATVTLSVQDTVGTTTTVTATVNAAVFPIDMYDNGEGTVGVGLGGIAESGLVKSYLPIRHMQSHYTYTTSGLNNADTTSYRVLATITVTATYQNAPIYFSIIARNNSRKANVYIKFANANSTDPALHTFTADYNYTQFYMYKTGTSTWQFISSMQEATYQNITIVDFQKPTHASGISVDIGGSTLSSLPSGATQATAVAYPYSEWADNANNATNVQTVNQWETTATTRYPIFVNDNNSGTGTYEELHTSGSLMFKQSTNWASINIGTQAYRSGYLSLYDANSNYHADFTTTQGLTANRTVYIPNANGTLLVNNEANYVSLWTGSLTASNAEAYAIRGGYSAFLVVGKAGSDTAFSSVAIPTGLIGTSQTLWQLGNANTYTSFYVSYNSNTITVKKSNSAGSITAIYGIK